MTILHLISSGGLYGAEAVILNLSRVLNVSGEHRSILAVFDHGPNTPAEVRAAAQVAGVELHEVACTGQMDRGVPARLRELVQRTGADVVHAHGYKADVYAGLGLRGRVPLVSTCHTWYDNDVAVRIYGAVDRWILRRFDGVVAVSDEVRHRLLRSGVRAGRIRSIRNGIDLRPFASAHQPSSEQGAGQNPTQGAAMRIGLVGRLAPEKGVDIFLRAISVYLRDRPERASHFNFVIVGEGPERARLEALRKELHLENSVEFNGHCRDMPAFYASLDLLVSASRQEGLPIALLEGMSSGLPLLATSVGEVPQLSRPEGTALLVPPNDPVALAEGLAVLIDDPQRRQAMGFAARRLIAQQFSAEAMATDYLDLYRSVLPTHAPARAARDAAAQAH